MQRMALLVLALASLTGVVWADTDDEQKKFAGTWKVTKGSVDGTAMTADEMKEIRLVFAGDAFTFKGGPVEKATTFKVSTILQTIEIAPPNGESSTLRGLYKFKDGKLTLCITEGEKAPTTFEAGPNRLYLELAKE